LLQHTSGSFFLHQHGAHGTQQEPQDTPSEKLSGTVLVESVSQSKCITKVFVVVRRVLHAVLSAAPVSTPYGSLMCGAPSQPFRWSMLSAGSKVAAASSTTSTVDQNPSHCLLSVIVF
jgi:hypothetical protein